MLLRNGRVACIGLLAVAALAAPAPAQTTLRYQFKEGEKLNYLMEQKMAMKMSVMGMDIAMDMNQTIDLSWNIAKVNKDGSAQMTQKFDRVRFSMDSPLGKINYDSKDGKLPDGPFGEMLGPMFKALSGLEISMTMDTRGETKDLKIPDSFLKALKDMPAGAAGLGQMFSEDSLKQTMSQSGLILPPKAVSKGDSWDTKMEMKMAPLGKMNVTNAYKFDGQVTRDGKKLEAISVTPTMKFEPDPNAQFTLKLKTEDSKGTNYFDNAIGRLVEVAVTSNMDMEISIAGQTINQKLQQTVTMKLQGKK
jgi:hypothetical protein